MKDISFKRLIIAFLLFPALVFAQEPIKLLSGLENGTYYHLAMDIASNSSQPVEVLVSGGSVENFNQLMEENDINIAFMQYDVLMTNKLINSKLPNEVRVMFPLFLDEEIHLVSKKGSKITKLKHLAGKKVGIGSIGQGAHVTAVNIKNKTGIDWQDVEINSNEALQALLAGEIDAYFYVGGLPVKSLEILPDTTQIQLVSIKHKSLKDTYKSKTIDGGTYKWQSKKVSTYAVPTLIVVKVKNMTPELEKQVNKLLEDINTNLPKMQKSGHPKWNSVYYQNQEIDWPYYYAKAKVD
ncbi:MAG: TAXI family TRAP transporter solute-binding subunit [Bacteroidales bacterium]|nr:TAXI family TRAP transporter solute-binding subunit [Bacteroidales bacterium]